MVPSVTLGLWPPNKMPLKRSPQKRHKSNRRILNDVLMARPSLAEWLWPGKCVVCAWRFPAACACFGLSLSIDSGSTRAHDKAPRLWVPAYHPPRPNRRPSLGNVVQKNWHLIEPRTLTIVCKVVFCGFLCEAWFRGWMLQLRGRKVGGFRLSEAAQ